VRVTIVSNGGTCELHTTDARMENAITSALMFNWTRSADLFVATAMDLVPRGHALRGVVDKMVMAVIALDTQDLIMAHANDVIMGNAPALLHLVGKSTYSGYAQRRAEFDALMAMANLINERVRHPEVRSCYTCLWPMQSGKCASCTTQNLPVCHA